jgi:hypothetical protein
MTGSGSAATPCPDLLPKPTRRDGLLNSRQPSSTETSHETSRPLVARRGDIARFREGALSVEQLQAASTAIVQR